MGLAHARVSVADFHTIHDHLVSHMPDHRNMHLRKARTRKRTKNLRFLHAMYAPQAANVIDGMISGPGIFWSYQLSVANATTQIQVFAQVSSSQEDDGLEETFLHDILARVREEQAMALAVAQGTKRFPPNYLPGRFYLRRALPGMAATHPRCQAALAAYVLSPPFVPSSSKVGVLRRRSPSRAAA